jgi:teichuronic acid exporter
MLYGIINPIITRILTPLFAEIQTDRNKIKGVYFKLIETLAITNLPIYFMVSIFSKTILFYLYGEQYVAGAFILSILAIYYGLLSISNPVGSLQIALGRTDIGFYWTIYRVLSTLVVVYLASFYNIETLVLFFLLLSVVNTFAMWRFQVFIMIKMSLKEFLAALLKPLAAILSISIPFYLILWTKTSLVYSILGSLTILIIYSLIAFKFFSKSYIISLVNRGYIHFFNSNKI